MEGKSLSVYERRRDTVKKKAKELSCLCNVDVCVLCFSPTGDFTSWPEDPSRLHATIEKYKSACCRGAKRRRREILSLSDVLDSKIKALHKQLSSDRQQLDLLSKESLEALAGCLESKLQAIERRIGVLNADAYAYANYYYYSQQQKQQEVECFPQPILNLEFNQAHGLSMPSDQDWRGCDDDHEDHEFSAVLQSLLSDPQQPVYNFGVGYENGQSLLGNTVLAEPIWGPRNY